MNTKTKATIEDLYKIDGKAEIINGEIVEMSPSGPQHGRAAMKLSMSLYEYEIRTGKGHVTPDNVGFIVNLPQRQSFSPDAGYYLQDETGLKFVQGAPIFAAEVRSAGDYGPKADRAYAEKRRDYFAAGTQVVWDVDLQGGDVVRSYRTPDHDNPAAIFHRGELADAEPALPGWQMPVDDLFK